VKLLFDQNISYRLVKRIAPRFPGSQQLRKLGLDNRPDKEIWDYAKNEEYVMVTFGSDFYDLSLAYGHPPKLIWLKTGNMTTMNLEKLLFNKADQIESFVRDIELGCLEILD
jgi:predicted nuclease of predicted toxin-antitoxin system